MSARWSDDEDKTLILAAWQGFSARIAARLLSRTQDAIYARARRLDIEWRFWESNAEAWVYLEDGGFIVRETFKNLPPRWMSASRTGGSFNAEFCDNLLKNNIIRLDKDGRAYGLVADE